MLSVSLKNATVLIGVSGVLGQCSDLLSESLKNGMNFIGGDLTAVLPLTFSLFSWCRTDFGAPCICTLTCWLVRRNRCVAVGDVAIVDLRYFVPPIIASVSLSSKLSGCMLSDRFSLIFVYGSFFCVGNLSRNLPRFDGSRKLSLRGSCGRVVLSRLRSTKMFDWSCSILSNRWLALSGWPSSLSRPHSRDACFR